LPRAKDEFSLEAELYDRIWGSYDYDTDVKFLADLFQKHHCTNIVDIGCGTGNHALKLSTKRYAVTGIDISPTMLKMARNKDQESKVRFVRADMKALGSVVPKGERFDAAISLGQVVSHLHTDREVVAFLTSVAAILRKRGLLVLSAMNAAKINDEYLNRLLLDHVINEEKIQVAAFAQNIRDDKDPNTIIWKPIYLIKQGGKLDLQMREHSLRWFKFSDLKEILTKQGFKIEKVLSGPLSERFNEKLHTQMWFVATAQ
jgi:SAM-dependent methyltransferase